MKCFALSSLLLLLFPLATNAFAPLVNHERSTRHHTGVSRMAMAENSEPQDTTTRRVMLRDAGLFLVAASAGLQSPSVAMAATKAPLSDLLYTLLRVKEATEQETRLIKSGKFKDVQRANIKLAAKFMVENYRLNDTINQAAGYIDGNARRIEAGQIGQNAVQNLLTILEYFDSSDVQNLKVGSDSMAGKETLVLKGLDAARRNIEEFLTFFPTEEVEAAKAKVAEENRLNEREFDPEIGVIINLKK